MKTKSKFSPQLSFKYLLITIYDDQKIIKTSQSGFSLVEVLVTMLVISGFLLGSLQATVVSTLIRIQAQDKQEANNWIQKDLNLIKYQASILPSNSSTCNTSTYGELLRSTLTSESFSATQKIEIDDRAYQVFRNYNSSDNTLQINYTVAYASGVSSTSAHPRYDDNASYPSNSSTAPDVNNPNVVATLTTEVIPDAAFTCS